MNIKDKIIPGATKDDNRLHQKHHKSMARRQFLSSLGMGGAFSFMMAGFPIKAISGASLMSALSNSDEERILVLVQLGGGNDGLNTLVPMYDYDHYRSVRPQIGLNENQLISLTDDIAIPANCTSWESLWKDGKMKAIQAVGYPNQNFSHFRSADIWSTGSDANEEETAGWLGKYLSNVYPDFETDPPTVPPAVQIGGIGSLIFNNGMFNLAVNVTNPEELSEIAKNGALYNTENVPDNCYGEELRFLRTVTNSTFIYSEAIQEAYLKGANAVEYQPVATDLSNQFSIVSRLIKGGLGTKIYMVSIDGFDTHAGQNEIHPFLLEDIANAVKAFYEDLAADGFDEQVLTMTFSEFGRRIEENASRGTDHGSAAPVLLFGPALNGNGLIGENPDLRQGDQYGNLAYQIDFRSIYATLLENWLCVDGELVDQLMGNHFARIESLGLVCGGLTSVSQIEGNPSEVQHRPIYNADGQIAIQYILKDQASIHLEVFSITGQNVGVLQSRTSAKGSHLVFLQRLQSQLANGIYVYRLRVNNKHVYSAKFRIG